MEYDWTHIGPVAVRNYYGGRTVYACLDDAVRGIDYPKIKYRRQDGSFISYSWLRHSTWGPISDQLKNIGTCELRDEHGNLIPDWVIDLAIGRTGIRYYTPWTRHYRKHLNAFRVRAAYRRGNEQTLRRDPKLPSWRPNSTGKRSPQYLRELREFEALKDNDDTKDLGVTIKARKRLFLGGWDYYDDYYDRSDYGVKCWKKYRRHRWKD